MTSELHTMISEFVRECSNWGALMDKVMEDEMKQGLSELVEFFTFSGRPNNGPKIEAASSTIRQKESFGGYFKPNVYAFGPIHHGDSDLYRGQIMKVKLAVHFLKLFFETTKEVLELFLGIKQHTREFGSWYGLRSFGSISSTSLLFFTDGCALLCYMYLSNQNQLAEFSKLGIESCDDDLFLLENQIPYTLLEFIISKLSINEDRIRKYIDAFVNLHCTNLGFDFQQKSQIVEKQELVPYHLLDLLWVKAGFMDHHRAASTSNPPPDPQPQPQPRSYSVQEIKALGVKLMPHKYIQLIDMSFEMAGGFSCVLKIHPIIVEPSTINKVVNLMAYELSLDLPNDRKFISYICFLGSHITTVEDVSELRSANVLQHSPPSDEFVLQFFREVATHLEPNSIFYVDVKKKIEAYCASLVKANILTDLARLIFRLSDAAADLARRLYTEYRKSPWTVLGVIAAVVAPCLTAVQKLLYSIPSGRRQWQEACPTYSNVSS